MKNKERLRTLAEQHGVKTTKRVWFTKLDENRKYVDAFMDVPRPLDEIYDDLVAKGVLS